MITDSTRLDFIQKHPHCVVACVTTRYEPASWYAARPGSNKLDGKNFSALRAAIDYAMSPVSGIAPADLVPGDYCEAKVRHISNPECYNVRLCRVEETHGHILKVATATRKNLVALDRKDVVGLGWRKV